MTNEEKVRENRLRRMAQRQGLRLVKSRRRDPQALDYGCYYIVDERNCLVAGGDSSSRPDFSLDDVEVWLSPAKKEDRRARGRRRRTKRA